MLEQKSCFTLVILISLILLGKTSALDHMASGRTYDPNILVKKRYTDSKGGYDIILIHGKTKKESKLYTTSRGANLHFSTDMEWVVINDAAGSDATYSKLFRRDGKKGSIQYALDVDLTKTAWEFFEKQSGKNPKGLDHTYLMAQLWLYEPHAILLTLTGHGAPNHYKVRYWTCAYLVDEQRFTTDLDALNSTSVVEE